MRSRTCTYKNKGLIMKKLKFEIGLASSVALAISVFAVAATPVFAAPKTNAGPPIAAGQSRYLIEYNPGNKQAVANLIASQGGKVAYDYSSLFNGVAADLSDKGAKTLRQSGLIKTIEADDIRTLHGEAKRSVDSAREESFLSSRAERSSTRQTAATSAKATSTSAQPKAANATLTKSATAGVSPSTSSQTEGSTPFEDGAIPQAATPSSLPAGFPGPVAFAEFVGWDRDRAQSDQVWSLVPNNGVADNGIASPLLAPGAITGAGVTVGVLDTGIDYDHPDLVANIQNDCGSGVVRDFLTMDDCPMDDTFNGHGTSVASVIASAANGVGLVGNAPGATIRPYRVCDGGCPLSAIIGGIMQATADGVDVINMSFGGGAGKNFEASAIQAAAQAGIVLVASAGNESSQKVHFPAGYGQVLAVGATTITDAAASFTNYGGWVDITGPGVNNPTATCTGCVTEGFVDELTPNVASFSANEMTNSPISIVSNTAVENAGLACTALTPGSLTGKIALMQRGSCSFAIKVANAEAAGAVATIVSNNAAGNFFGTLGTYVPTGPSVSISQADGAALAADVASGATADVGIRRRNDIEYWLISGTSFSGPTVAGVAALVRAANPNLTELEVRNILTSTAQPIGPQVVFGAGMVNAYAAVQAAQAHP